MQEKYSGLAAKIYSILFITAFFGALLLQLFIPNFTLASISDGFLWRKDLIGQFNKFRFMVGDQVFYLSLVGKEGWLYYTGDKSIQDYQKNLSLNPKDLQKAMNSLSVIKRQVGKNGGKLIVIIAPDKQTIYPQYMPEQITVFGQASRMDQLMKFIQERKIDIELVDLRPVLIDASLSNEVYYKTDTHWNCLGAYYAYQKTMSDASISFPKLAPHPLSDFDLYVTDRVTMGISHMMMIQDQENQWDARPAFQQKPFDITHKSVNETRIATNNMGKDLPKAMVFGDSFYRTCFDRFFESHFSRTVLIDWKYMLKTPKLIDKEQPDIVGVTAVNRGQLAHLWVNSSIAWEGLPR